MWVLWWYHIVAIWVKAFDKVINGQCATKSGYWSTLLARAPTVNHKCMHGSGRYMWWSRDLLARTQSWQSIWIQSSVQTTTLQVEPTNKRHGRSHNVFACTKLYGICFLWYFSAARTGGGHYVLPVRYAQGWGELHKLPYEVWCVIGPDIC